MDDKGTGTGEGDASAESKIEKVAKDAAENDVDRFIEKMDLDVDPVGMDDEDKESYRASRRVMLRAIRKGHLGVNAEGEPVYTVRIGKNKGEIVTFHEPKGSTWSAMDQKKKGHEISKMFASMAEMTETSEAFFNGMFARDLKVCQAIVTLFLA